jgi:DNA modification methylase
MSEYCEQLKKYAQAECRQPLFLRGDALEILNKFPAESFDFCMTSPPYWKQREYQSGGLGLEPTYEQFINNLLNVFHEIKRVLKNTGSFWLNLGDTYQNKGLVGLPWRVALAMIDKQNWILRNDVIWNKIKGPDNSKDKLRNIHEHIFHFVKHPKDFYYDVDAIRSKPREAQVRNGAVISATGVSGVRYKRQLELSTSLTDEEKQSAFLALNETLQKIVKGELADFRMVIRNQQRTTHSNSEKVSGRAKELVQKGFYILRYHPNGSKPSDVWELIPEDTTNRSEHYASYPEDLCKVPLLATCPPNGIALDPFCGTGTTNLVAKQLSRKSVGIDLSQRYIDYAVRRCQTPL